MLLGVSPAAPGAAKQANLEFINPKFRDEYLSRTEGADDQDNPWVWLNAYSRIPVSIAHLEQERLDLLAPLIGNVLSCVRHSARDRLPIYQIRRRSAENQSVGVSEYCF